MNGAIYEGETILDRWAAHFENLAKPMEGVFDEAFCSSVNSELVEMLHMTRAELDDSNIHVLADISIQEIRDLVFALPSHKAPGPDNIQGEQLHVRDGGRPLLTHLLTLFDLLVWCEHIPPSFQ